MENFANTVKEKSLLKLLWHKKQGEKTAKDTYKSKDFKYVDQISYVTTFKQKWYSFLILMWL